ncbi:MAG: hypothetical protein AAF467_14110 [Actinomycetota bacterium]
MSDTNERPWQLGPIGMVYDQGDDGHTNPLGVLAVPDDGSSGFHAMGFTNGGESVFQDLGRFDSMDQAAEQIWGWQQNRPQQGELWDNDETGMA